MYISRLSEGRAILVEVMQNPRRSLGRDFPAIQHATHCSATRQLDTHHLKQINRLLYLHEWPMRVILQTANSTICPTQRGVNQHWESVHLKNNIHSFQQTKTGCASGKYAGGVDPDSPPSACLLWEGWGERTDTSPLPQSSFRDAGVRNNDDSRVWLRDWQRGHQLVCLIDCTSPSWPTLISENQRLCLKCIFVTK